jgi:hypothetical protein
MEKPINYKIIPINLIHANPSRVDIALGKALIILESDKSQ